MAGKLSLRARLTGGFAMVAAIALTHRKRGDSRQMNPAEQVKVKRADRIRMVNLKPQKPEAPKEEDA